MPKSQPTQKSTSALTPLRHGIYRIKEGNKTSNYTVENMYKFTIILKLHIKTSPKKGLNAYIALQAF